MVFCKRVGEKLRFKSVFFFFKELLKSKIISAILDKYGEYLFLLKFVPTIKANSTQ